MEPEEVIGRIRSLRLVKPLPPKKGNRGNAVFLFLAGRNPVLA